MAIELELRPLLEYGLQESVDLLNLGFSDYFVHIELSLPVFLNMTRVDGLDLGSSRIIYLEDEAVGIALIARRGWTSRLAAMSLSPASRGRGAGRAAMDLLLIEASARRDRSMVLEVIESNTPAVRLYQACGFKIERHLTGFQGNSPQLIKAASLEEVDIREVARRVTMYGMENLPWQISGESLSQAGSPGKAYRLEDADIVISNPDAEQVAIRSVIVHPAARRQGQATRLIQAVFAEFPDKIWTIPAICPDEIGSLFEKVGFRRDTLSQFQMRKEIHMQ